MKCIPKPSLVVIFVRLVSGLDHPGISAVAEAYVQGLADNLAFFVSKCGWEAFLSATCEACAALDFWRDSPWSSIGAFSSNVSHGFGLPSTASGCRFCSRSLPLLKMLKSSSQVHFVYVWRILSYLGLCVLGLSLKSSENRRPSMMFGRPWFLNQEAWLKS